MSASHDQGEWGYVHWEPEEELKDLSDLDVARDRSATRLAEVISDLRAGHVSCPHGRQDLFDQLLIEMQTPSPVIDATELYCSLETNRKPIYLYEDHPSIASPWPSAFIGYSNRYENIYIMHIHSQELSDRARRALPSKFTVRESVDLKRLRWMNMITVWIGGHSRTRKEDIPLMGPMHMWRHLVYDNGEPADLSWYHLMKSIPREHWDLPQLVFLGALNFINCRNVDIVEPIRKRKEARQIARTGVRVSVINVFPVGKSTRSESKNKGCGVPLTSVRGHFSHYGPDYGKGLLFGKLAGRFWIPQHARGDKELGETKHDYVLKP